MHPKLKCPIITLQTHSQISPNRIRGNRSNAVHRGENRLHFNKASLKNGESLRPMQRAGFVPLSIIFSRLRCLFWANTCWLILREGTVSDGRLFWRFFFGFAALVLFLSRLRWTKKRIETKAQGYSYPTSPAPAPNPPPYQHPTPHRPTPHTKPPATTPEPLHPPATPSTPQNSS